MDSIKKTLTFTAGQTQGLVFRRGIDPTNTAGEHFSYGGVDVDQRFGSVTVVNRTTGDIRFHTENDITPLNAINLLTATEKVETVSKDGAYRVPVVELARIRIYATAAGQVDVYAHENANEAPEFNPSGADVSINTSSGGVAVGSANQTDGMGWLKTAGYELYFHRTPISAGPDAMLFRDEASGTGAAVGVDEDPGFVLITGSSDAGYAYRMTRSPMPPRGGLIGQFPCAFPVGVAGVPARAGFHQPTDVAYPGVYLKAVDGVLTICRSGYDGEVETARALWNGDKLDGTGASGVTLDFTDMNDLIIDFRFGGAETVDVGFLVNGAYIIAHSMHFSGQNYPVFSRGIMSAAASVEGTGQATIHLGAIKVWVPQGSKVGVPISVDNDVTALTATTDAQELVSVLGTTAIAYTKAIGFRVSSALKTGAVRYRASLHYNATFTAAGTVAATPGLMASKRTGAGIMTDPGYVLASGYGDGLTPLDIALPVDMPFSGKIGTPPTDVNRISLVVQTFSLTDSVVGSIQCIEE